VRRFFRLIHYLTSKISPRSRKSDIENERLPPDLFDADSEEGKAILGSSSLPSTPAEGAIQPAPPAPNGVAEGLEKAIAAKITPSRINTGTSSLSQTSSISPISPSGSKKGHSRQASLGTTMTSPSNRRRSLESTMSLIQGVLDGKPAPGRIEEYDDVNGLTDKLAGSSVGKNASPGPGRSPTPAR
jgi:serine/threonine-protein phosphatase 2B catalytic subunit